MNQSPSPAPKRRRSRRRLLAGAAGAAVGFALAFTFYLLIIPVLEGSTGLIRELQGLAWNLVPVLTLLGGIAGWLLSGSQSRHGPR